MKCYKKQTWREIKSSNNHLIWRIYTSKLYFFWWGLLYCSGQDQRSILTVTGNWTKASITYRHTTDAAEFHNNKMSRAQASNIMHWPVASVPVINIEYPYDHELRFKLPICCSNYQSSALRFQHKNCYFHLYWTKNYWGKLVGAMMIFGPSSRVLQLISE